MSDDWKDEGGRTAGGVVPFRRPPGAHTVSIGGEKYVLSDIVPALMESLADTPDDPRIIRGPAPSDPFKYLWVYNLDRKTLAAFRVTDGNEKFYGSAKDDVAIVVKLDRKGHLNRVDDGAFRRIEAEMRKREDETIRRLEEYIRENETTFQKNVNRLTRAYFDEVVRPKVERAIADVRRGATPLGFKPMNIPKPVEEQKVVFAIDSVLSKELTTSKVDAYLTRHGVDLDAGDNQASYWALNDVRDEVYDEYARSTKTASADHFRYDLGRVRSIVDRCNDAGSRQESIEEFSGYFECSFQLVAVDAIKSEDVWKDVKLQKVLKDIDDGKSLEPISLVDDNGHLKIEDGIHRFNASKMRGFDRIPAIVRKWVRVELPPAASDQPKLDDGTWVKLHRSVTEDGERYQYGVIVRTLGSTTIKRAKRWRYEVALVNAALGYPTFNDLVDTDFEPTKPPTWGRNYKLPES